MATEDPPARTAAPHLSGLLAAASWLALCLLWFDVAEPVAGSRPHWALVGLTAVAFAAALTAWARARWTVLAGGQNPRAGTRGVLWLVVLLAVAFRLPLAWHGAAGYVTADGALSGLVALDIRDGQARHVFVPNVPYSGSLKSHATALLATFMDPARAFALASVAFFAVFVAAAAALAERAAGAGLAAGLYLAFAPPFLTRYSLSNDGNYVEVMALGTLALLLAARWSEEVEAAPVLALVAGVSLGLAFWSHLLAVIPLAAVCLFALLSNATGALRGLGPFVLGFALGDAPGLLWNAQHGGLSFLYLVPGVAASGSGAEPVGPARALVTDHLPVLLGYDAGYARPLDLALLLLSSVAVGAAGVGAAKLLADVRARGNPAARAVLVLAGINIAVAAFALPSIAGNPRYLLPMAGAVAVFLARALARGAPRALLAVLVAGGTAASLAQVPGTFRKDAEWRAFVAALRQEGVRWCHTDFFLATPINFLSAGSVICSAKLGPTTTEYFFRFRREVEAAPEAALIAVNRTAAEKLERRLERMGVRYERRFLLKPVLLPRSRKVDPEELFPQRDFPLR